MSGNKKSYNSFPEWILGITHEIWEEKGVNKIRNYYHKDTIVRSADGVIIGNENVIKATRETLAEFPDRVLLGEDVIWAQTGENSWFSSHRIMSKATHRGNDGRYGYPTNKEILYRTIADCHAVKSPEHGWVINDEWLVRDQGAMYKLLELPYDRQEHFLDPLDDEDDPLQVAVAGPYMGRGNDAEPGLIYEDHLMNINDGEINLVGKMYDRACQLELGEGRTVHGIDEAEKFWMGLRASFPDAEFTIDHRIGQIEEGRPPRSAVRWRLRGDHSGYGLFGPPSSQFVDIMGISHAEFSSAGILREYIMIDHVSVWKQINRDDELTIGSLLDFGLGDDDEDDDEDEGDDEGPSLF